MKGPSNSSETSLSCSIGCSSDSFETLNFGEWLRRYAMGAYPTDSKPLDLPTRPSSTDQDVPESPLACPPALSLAHSERGFRKLGWLPAPPPPNESERLKSLYRYGILSKDPDNPVGRNANPTINKIVKMVQKVFNVPTVVVMIVEKENAPVLASVGYDNAVIDRGTSLCGHSILYYRPYVMLDATKDFRFTNLHPSTGGASPVRFYASTQLRNKDGFALGTLCLLDFKPRDDFSEQDQELLVDFGNLVMKELESLLTESHLAQVSQLSGAMDQLNREIAGLGDLAKEKNLNKAYDLASTRIRETLNLKGGCSILDTSAFTLVRTAASDTLPGTQRYQILGKTKPNQPLPVISACVDPDFPTPPPTPTGSLLDTVQLGSFLDHHPGGKVFTADELPIWTGYSLPPNAQYVFLLPMLQLDKSALALICVWTCDETQEISEVDAQFVRAIEGLLMSSSILRTIQGADHAKFAFISSMSHELRTPLHGILASTELLADSDLVGEQRAHLDTIRLCGVNLLEIVNHVLDFTKSSATVMGEKRRRSIAPLLATINLSNLVEEAVDSVCVSYDFSETQRQGATGAIGNFYYPMKPSDQTNPSRVEVLLDIGPGLEDVVVKADATGLRRLVYNLLTNALKYTKKGSVRVTLNMSAPAPDTPYTSFSLSVIDTGIGMSRSFVKNHLFAPFSQESAAHPGAGLGLSITQSIVRAMNGFIDVQSVEHQGTTAKVVVPLEVVQGSSTATPSFPTTPLTKSSTAFLSGLSPEMWHLVTGYLKQWELNISASPSPAWDDIVILDDSSNPHALAKYQSIFRTVHLSSRPSSSDRQSIPHYQIIPKPCGPRKLYQALSSILSEEFTPIKLESPIDPPPTKPPGPARSKTTPQPPIIPSIVPTVIQPIYKSHVLIVEDNPVNRSVLRAFFNKKKVPYKEACDGQEGFEIFKSYPLGFFSFICMDLQMPVKNGFDSTTLIRQFERIHRQENPSTSVLPVTIFALTGSSSSESEKRAVEVGMDGFLSKPVVFKVLWTHVQDAMGICEA